MSQSVPQRRSESIDILCHEVRGTIAPLANWQRLLHRSAIKTEDLGALADVLHRTVLVLSRLANDLAALEGTEASELSLTVAALDLREVVSSVTKILAPEALQKDIALRVQLPSEPVPMLGDFVRLTQVIANLLDNALKFTEHLGRVSVELRCAGGSAELAVIDTGIGIAPEFLPLAFEKFAREDMIIETFRHGATDFLKKPFPLDELVAAVSRATTRRRRPLSSGVPGIEADAAAAGPPPDPEVEGIVALVDRLYAEPLRLRDVAARAGIRPARVARIFRAATGLSVAEYIHRVRLTRAQHLLLTSDWSMTEIALAVGFYDLPHLDKAFHKWFGISPSDFRKRAALTKIAGRPSLQAESKQRHRA